MKVLLEINPKTGTYTIEVEGAHGTKCTDITNAITQGKKVLNQELKASYFETADMPNYLNED